MLSAATADTEFEILPFPVLGWSVEEYERVTELGILDEDDGLELLNGWIVHKMAKNPLHDGTVDEIDQCLTRLIPDGCCCPQCHCGRTG